MTAPADTRVLWPYVDCGEPGTVERHRHEVQARAVDGAERALAEHGSALVVLPTGLGKTVCFAELTRRYVEERGERVLIVAHTEELISQAVEKIQRFGGAGLRIEVEMAERSATIDGLYSPDVVVASVQSLCRPNRLARFPADYFGLVVIDEAHHATATTYRKIVDHFRGSVLDESGIVRIDYEESTHVLGVTATPDRRDCRALGDLFAASAFVYELREAIAAGLLVRMSVQTTLLPELDLSGMRMVAGDLSQGQLDERIKPALHPAAVKVAVQAGIRRTLAFLPSVATAHAFADYLREEGMSAAALDGSAPEEQRRFVVEQFRRGDIQALCNCALFTEGFDVPEVSCIAVLRPTTSRALYSQMIGRGTRLSPGKADLLVLDFPGVGFERKLVTPLDVLGGITDEDILRKLQAVLARAEAAGLPIDLLSAEAEAQIEDREEKERAAADRLRRGKQAQEIDVLGHEREAEPEWKVALRERWKLKPKEIIQYAPDEEHARRLVAWLVERRKAGMCSFRQGMLLRSKGLPARNVSFETASQWINGIAAAEWSVPGWVWAEAKEFGE